MRSIRLHGWFPRVYLALLVLAALPWLGIAVLAAQDSTAVDRTGLLGPVIDHFWPVIVVFLTSLTVKIAAKWSAFAATHEAVKWVALYAFALLYNKLAGVLGLVAVDPTAPVFALSAVQTAAAALVFKFGQHRTPVATAGRIG